MIALDTNALIRVLVEDDQDQANSVQKLILFADHVIVNQAIEKQAKKLFSFNRKLQKKFPGYVVEKISRKNL